MPRADVAVPGFCLSDYWAFWTLAPQQQQQHLYEKAKIGNEEGSEVQRRKSVFGV